MLVLYAVYAQPVTITGCARAYEYCTGLGCTHDLRRPSRLSRHAVALSPDAQPHVCFLRSLSHLDPGIHAEVDLVALSQICRALFSL